VECAAGLALALLGCAGLLALVFVPIPVCTVPAHSARPAPDVRSATLLSAGAETDVWLYLMAMVIMLVVGAAGAIEESRSGPVLCCASRDALLLVWESPGCCF